MKNKSNYVLCVEDIPKNSHYAIISITTHVSECAFCGNRYWEYMYFYDKDEWENEIIRRTKLNDQSIVGGVPFIAMKVRPAEIETIFKIYFSTEK